MVDRENRRCEDDRREQNVVLYVDQSLGNKAEAEEGSDCIDEPDTSRIYQTSERSVGGGDDAPLATVDTVDSDYDANEGHTKRTRKKRPRRPKIARKAPKFIKIKERMGTKITRARTNVLKENVEKDAEEDNECGDMLPQDHNKPRPSSTSERSVEEEDSEVMSNQLDGVDYMEVDITDEATGTLSGVPTHAGTSSIEGPFNVPEIRTTTDSRSVSAIAVISLFLFVVLYPRFGGQTLFVDSSCFTLLIFYFYRIEAFRRN